MSPIKATAYIAVAFLVGALFPLLGLLAGAVAVGTIYGSRQQPKTLMTPEVAEEIRKIEADIQRQLR
ncbi:MAG TPA: hypothetical protein VKP88_01170 [Candidatus Paceibacterota bacterium]|nr:hypothetical protein [Candidatus Paceibacterota bacterium]